MIRIVTRRRSRPLVGAGTAAFGALATLVGASGSWAGLTADVAASARGLDSAEGWAVVALTIVALVTALVAVSARDARALGATALAAIGALIAEGVFAVRLPASYLDVVADDNADTEAIRILVEDALTLGTGWALAVAGSLLTVAAGLVTAFRGDPQPVAASPADG